MNDHEINANDKKIEEKDRQKVVKLLAGNRAAALGLAILLAVGPLAAGCGRDEPPGEEYQSAGQDIYQSEEEDEDDDIHFIHTRKSSKKISGVGYVSYSGGS